MRHLYAYQTVVWACGGSVTLQNTKPLRTSSCWALFLRTLWPSHRRWYCSPQAPNFCHVAHTSGFLRFFPPLFSYLWCALETQFLSCSHAEQLCTHSLWCWVFLWITRASLMCLERKGFLSFISKNNWQRLWQLSTYFIRFSSVSSFNFLLIQTRQLASLEIAKISFSFK